MQSFTRSVTLCIFFLFKLFSKLQIENLFKFKLNPSIGKHSGHTDDRFLNMLMRLHQS